MRMGKNIMANIVPATNIQAAAVAGFITTLILHVCAANGIVIPPDVADALPGVLALLVAHISDMVTGDNKKTTPPISQSQASVNQSNA